MKYYTQGAGNMIQYVKLDYLPNWGGTAFFSQWQIQMGNIMFILFYFLQQIDFALHKDVK